MLKFGGHIEFFYYVKVFPGVDLDSPMEPMHPSFVHPHWGYLGFMVTVMFSIYTCRRYENVDFERLGYEPGYSTIMDMPKLESIRSMN